MSTSLFNTLESVSNNMNENNDCAVKGIAIVMGIGYNEAYAALKAAGRRDRKGVHTHQITEAIKSLGGTIEQSILTTDSAGHLNDSSGFYHAGGPQFRTHNMTMSSVTREFPTGNYLVFKRDHVAGMTDGTVHDWTAGRKHRVLSVWKISQPAPKPAPKAHHRPATGKASDRRYFFNFTNTSRVRRGSTMHTIVTIVRGYGSRGATKATIVERFASMGVTAPRTGKLLDPVKTVTDSLWHAEKRGILGRG